MSNKTVLLRYGIIIKSLKKNDYLKYEELNQIAADQEAIYSSGLGDTKLTFSQRTLQRDIQDIYQLFGLVIENSKVNGYYIADKHKGINSLEFLLETFDLVNTLSISSEMDKHLLLDKRKAKGTEHMFPILNAIKRKRQISFNYTKYWDDNWEFKKHETKRVIDPIAIKESNAMWYVVGKDLKDGNVKTFGLDRLSNLSVLASKAHVPEDFNLDNYFKYSYGIFGRMNPKPDEVILKFNMDQGRYIKALPWHESQVVEHEDETTLKIKLTIEINYELVMKIASYGSDVKVEQPKKLRKQLYDHLSQGASLYMDEFK